MGNATQTDNGNEVGVHVFERAGLGVAPFRFVGCYEDRGPKVISHAGGCTMTTGAPGQPMGTCKYCGTGIAECCVIEDSKGTRFVVGNECVRRTGDAGLLRAYKRSPEKRAIDRKRRQALAARKLEEIDGLLSDSAIRQRLAAMPHARGRDGETALDYCSWMRDNCGDAGRARLIKWMRAALAD